MSLLTLVGAAASGQASTPPPTGGPVAAFPATSDTRLVALRPKGRRVAALTVDRAYPVTATNFHTIGAASDAGQELVRQDIRGDSVTSNGDPGPDTRIDIFVAPGTYTEALGWSGCNLINTSATEPLVIESDAFSSGVFHTYGDCYLEGVTLRALSSTNTGAGGWYGAKYPLHVTATGATCVFALCTLDVQNTVGGAMAGADLGDRTVLHFYRLSGSVTGSDPATTPLFNLHGALNQSGQPIERPVRVIFEDCAVAPSYSPVEDGHGDQLWAVGTTPTANAVAGRDATLVTTGDTGTYDALGWWAHAYYYPSTIGQVASIGYTDPAAAPFAPVVGRIYYVPVPVDEAIHVMRLGCTVTTAAGSIDIAWVRDRRAGDTPADHAGVSGQGSGGPQTPLTVGTLDVAPYYYSYVYPGEHAWVGLKFTDSAARVLGSSTIAAALPCWWTDDGTTYTRQTTGAFPLATIRSVT